MSADLVLIMLVDIRWQRSRSRSDVETAEGHSSDSFTSSGTLRTERGSAPMNVHCAELIDNKNEKDNEDLYEKDNEDLKQNVRRGSRQSSEP